MRIHQNRSGDARTGARLTTAFVLAAGLVVLSVGAGAQGRVDFLQEPACQSLTPTSMGGPAPKSPNVMVLRWLGAANHEIAFRDTTLLLDAYYTRVPPARPLGFSRDDIKKANAIYIGHPHGDHFNDAPYVAQRINAPLIGSPISSEAGKKMGLPDKLLVSVTGNGEVQKYNGMTVEAVLGHHSVRPAEMTRPVDAAFRTLQDAMGLKRTPESEKLERETKQGSNDPHLNDQGTITFLFTFDNRFRMIYTDTSGPTTPQEEKVMQRIGGKTNVAIVGYQGFVFSGPSNEAVMPQVRLFKPDVLLPTHHDDSGGNRPDLAMYPFFMAVRDEFPRTRGISPMYKTPVCFDVQNGNVFVGDPWAWGPNASTK